MRKKLIAKIQLSEKIKPYSLILSVLVVCIFTLAFIVKKEKS